MLLANFANLEKLTNKHANIHTKKYLASDIFIMKNLWKGESLNFSLIRDKRIYVSMCECINI